MNNLFDLPPGVREQALYTSFLNMVPGLLMAGARSPNPAQAAQGYGSAIQGFTQGGQDYMNNWRNMQALGFATQKAQREQEAAKRREAYIASLPESERPLAELGPEQFVTGKMRAPPKTLMELQAEAEARAKGTAAAQGSGPFMGTGMDAQVYNLLLKGDPSSPEYAAAYSHAAQPRVTFDPQSGQAATIRPDMTAFRPPTKIGAIPGATPGPNLPAVSVGQVTTPPPKPLTEAQGKAGLFASRMENAESVLRDFEDQGTSVVGRVLENVPGGNYLQSKSYQQFEQARRDFINAVLRRESGAVISQDEFSNAERQYFPVPGDKKEVIVQKQKNRMTALEGIAREAGLAYQLKHPPVIGTVEDGFRFKGGNPASPDSWEKVQ